MSWRFKCGIDSLVQTSLRSIATFDTSGQWCLSVIRVVVWARVHNYIKLKWGFGVLVCKVCLLSFRSLSTRLWSITSLASPSVEEPSRCCVLQPLELIKNAWNAVCPRSRVIQQLTIDTSTTTDSEGYGVEPVLLRLIELRIVAVGWRVVSGRRILRLDSLSETEFTWILPHGRLHIIIARPRHILSPSVDAVIVNFLVRTVRQSKTVTCTLYSWEWICSSLVRSGWRWIFTRENPDALFITETKRCCFGIDGGRQLHKLGGRLQFGLPKSICLWERPCWMTVPQGIRADGLTESSSVESAQGSNSAWFVKDRSLWISSQEITTRWDTGDTHNITNGLTTYL